MYTTIQLIVAVKEEVTKNSLAIHPAMMLISEFDLP